MWLDLTLNVVLFTKKIIIEQYNYLGGFVNQSIPVFLESATNIQFSFWLLYKASMCVCKPSNVLCQWICTFNLTLCCLAHNPSVVFFFGRPLIEINGSPGRACIQNNTILEKERATEVKKDINVTKDQTKDIAKP